MIWVEMNVRYTITVTGDVQGAGYRAAVRGIAKKMKITGYVENLEDSDVKVVAEGEKVNLEAFRKAVAIRGEHMNVEGMRTRKGKATGEFKGFRVKVADLASETFQGYATSEKYFSSLGSDIRTVGRKVDAVGGKVDTLTDHTDDSFASLDKKYHSISEVHRSMNENSQTMQREFNRTREELSRVVDSLVTLVRERKGGNETGDAS